MSTKVPPFDALRVAVVGDVMLDHYWYGDTARISPEAPVPVVRVNDTETRAGGAANVARNVASLNARTHLLGVIGDDEAGRTLEAGLVAAGVTCTLTRSADFDTIIKTRIISRHQQLLRLDREQPVPINAALGLVDHVTSALGEADVLVISDYGKGSLTQVGSMIATARRLNVAVVVDPKGREFERYRGASVLTPNQSEFEAVVGECADEAEFGTRAEHLLRQLALEALLITRGEHGMTLVQRGKPALNLPAEAREVFDVTGAGDTVVAVLACMVASGASVDDAARLANRAAGLVVSKLGASTVNRAELLDGFEGPHRSSRDILHAEALSQALSQARARGERIVMTNGCFDLLHAGHVRYLEQARGYGDRLLVALNDDASVARLKGPGRPLNPLSERARVLSALAAVDWVTAFGEDTPAALVAQVLPDVLVKGGDYRVEDIAGGDVVIANGGRVEVMDFVAGHSTSALLARIREDRT